MLTKATIISFVVSVLVCVGKEALHIAPAVAAPVCAPASVTF